MPVRLLCGLFVSIRSRILEAVNSLNYNLLNGMKDQKRHLSTVLKLKNFSHRKGKLLMWNPQIVISSTNCDKMVDMCIIMTQEWCIFHCTTDVKYKRISLHRRL